MTTMPPLQVLARHYYETRRLVLEEAGTEVTPWYRLSEEERNVARVEAQIIQEAWRRALEEQDAHTTMMLRKVVDIPPAAELPPTAAAAGV
ncbi:hypothetical protein ACIO3O_36905 [Streptomyces sp. NPDC087440]|uniref:hypothetical protein n=1 Tax=Streptomyces sp. NPDC087440 TaxID=3365790 RepID=UPI00382E3038